MKIYGNLDLMQNILKNAVVQHGTDYPTGTAIIGQLFYDENNKKLACYNGTQWSAVSPELPTVTEDATKYLDGLVDGIFKQKAFIEAPMTNLTVGSILDASKNLGENLKLLDDAATEAKSFTIKKAETAETGYLATYQMYHTVSGTETAVGEKINIPKDFLVTKAEVKTCIEADKPITGLVIGDKYIDFTVNVKEGTTTDSHMYIAVKDMVTIYAAGDGIEFTETTTSSTIKAKAYNGITIDSNGIAVKPKADSGIVVDSNGVSVKVGNGIEVTADGVKAKPADNGGITVDSNGISVKINTGKGIVVDASGIAAKAGNGITIDTNGIAAIAKTDAGIVVSSDGIAVKNGNGISLSSDGVNVKLKDSEASGLTVDGDGLYLKAASATQNGYLAKGDYDKWTKRVAAISKTTDANGKFTLSSTDFPGFNVTGVVGFFNVDGELALPGDITYASGVATVDFTTACATKTVTGTVIVNLTATT